MENLQVFHERRVQSERFMFDEFRLNVAARELTKEHRLLHTEPKVFDLLVWLVRNRDRVVHRHELSHLLWSDAVVCSGALDQCVATLRRVLGDSAREERYIRTVRRCGYRFVGAALLLSE